jgi:putative transposase
MNQMLINISTCKFRRSVRLPGGDVGSIPGDGTSKSAISRKFVAPWSAKLREWLASDLLKLNLLASQIDACTSATNESIRNRGVLARLG